MTFTVSTIDLSFLADSHFWAAFGSVGTFGAFAILLWGRRGLISAMSARRRRRSQAGNWATLDPHKVGPAERV